jgi:DNA gyrase/topoisomerase IV subunit B
MTNRSDPSITAATKSAKEYTKITFYPDLNKFDMVRFSPFPVCVPRVSE